MTNPNQSSVEIAHRAGRDARSAGRSIEQCPHVRGELREAWTCGWETEEMVRQAEAHDMTTRQWVERNAGTKPRRRRRRKANRRDAETQREATS